ncbi:MAG: ribonuclease Y [Chloroflexi bacterium]|nr:ribonuclease Y [Chloroflexota bacterium]
MDLVLALGLAVAALVLAAAGFAVGYQFKQVRYAEKVKIAEEEAARIVLEAQSKSKDIILEGKDEVSRIKEQQEVEQKKRRAELQEQERRLQQRRESLENRNETLERRARNLDNREKEIERKHQEIDDLKAKQARELERVAALSREEARAIFLKSVEEETRQDAARLMREVESRAREEGERKAREIISTVVQRIASEQVAEQTVSMVPIPNEEMKGRIIGRSGRNIRSIELATGADLVVDDTPEAIIVSCFDPVRREVARLAVSKLVADGRIHPARIEKVVEQAQKEVDQQIISEGERAAFEASVPNLHPEIIKLLGRLKFRTSYGQNQHAHAIETSNIAAMLAHELGADVALARAGALLHDIGKAVTHEVEGSHALIGADLARRYGVPARIVNCIAAHHGEEEMLTVEAMLVEAADAISGARPGARRETLEVYVKRLKALEEIATSFDGVAQAFAVQAGREIRIMVKPETIDDLAAQRLSKSIARKIEEGVEFPGQIRVTVIRETRAVEFAK